MSQLKWKPSSLGQVVGEPIAGDLTALALRAGIIRHKSLIKGQQLHQLIKWDLGHVKDNRLYRARKTLQRKELFPSLYNPQTTELSGAAYKEKKSLISPQTNKEMKLRFQYFFEAILKYD